MSRRKVSPANSRAAGRHFPRGGMRVLPRGIYSLYDTKMDYEENVSPFSRSLWDFLDPDTAAKAGLIKIYPPGARETLPRPRFITALEYDTRKVKPGALFFALSGLHLDGHDFIPGAIERGAAAIVYEKEPAEYREGVVYIQVKNSRFAMSPVADSFYGFPSRRMGIIGVTGTEGKSTTVYLIYQLLTLLGKKTGFISTVMRADGLNESRNSEHQTTPEAVTVQGLLAEMYRNGAEYAVIEASSHGLSKKTNRLGDVDFDAAVLTNVTHEHLEFHGTWEQYRNDKAELFRALDSSPASRKKEGLSGSRNIPSFGVINADDPSADFFAAAAGQKTMTFSVKGKEADLSVKRMESGAGGNLYDVFVKEAGTLLTVRDNLPGAFNAGNVLAALLVVSGLLSLEAGELIPLVPRLKPVLGRMTAVNKGQPFEVLVDYAHTPSSFEAVLPPLRERLNASGGRLICLFGSPGERDTQKRALQGEAAARYADIVILADEDPRGEDPMSILEEIAKGCFAAPGCETSPDGAAPEREAGRKMIRDKTLFLIPDRPRAIRKAFSLARKGDIALLLGKGHENSIIYANEVLPYDEIYEAETALAEAGFSSPSAREAFR